MFSALAVFVVATLSALTAATPAALESRQAATPLSPAQIASFRVYTLFSATVGCNPEETDTWTCGARCDALPDFQPTDSGGDGDAVQYWFVGFHPPLNSVMVVHQGTDFSKLQVFNICLLPILTDLDFKLTPLNETLFPGVPATALAHNGFRKGPSCALISTDPTLGSTADRILAAVKSTLAAHPDAEVSCTGHSLGAALSLLDTVFLRSQLPSTIPVKFVGFGTPRVGNPTLANHVDATLGDFTRINNKQDPVPQLPPRFLGFMHPSGEIHISADDEWLACPGPDSSVAGCLNDTEPSILNSTASDHVGPYDGIFLNGTCT
ncbi:lipase [Auricularia subglabra TFB-10046 SS5]|nr:lipase [Auricularia subglabra TFB-10046 SS5]